MNEKIYALYKGEDMLQTGTLQEIADAENVRLETIKFYTTPCYKRRVTKRKQARNYRELVCLDD